MSVESEVNQIKRTGTKTFKHSWLNQTLNKSFENSFISLTILFMLLERILVYYLIVLLFESSLTTIPMFLHFPSQFSSQFVIVMQKLSSLNWHCLLKKRPLKQWILAVWLAERKTLTHNDILFFSQQTHNLEFSSRFTLPLRYHSFVSLCHLISRFHHFRKYICQNILFKFALDFEIRPGLWMYGGDVRSDENAMKAAAHELKGLISYYSCNIEGLHFPLMALIDYKGFRVIAISILPINDNTICYGMYSYDTHDSHFL